jgi:predicted MFS family arabinose efflux permease
MGACLGLALGSALNIYTLSLFGPPLIAEFGWTKAQFALVSSLSLISLFFIPFVGRFVDRVGPRAAGMIGYVAVPLCFFAFSMMSGDILEFYAITLVKNVLGVLTTSLVFCRVIVERFDTARGMALSVAMTGPPLIGAIAAPIVGEIIDSEGWRMAYRVLSLVSFLGGMVAITLIGLRKRGTQPEHGEQPQKKHAPLTRKEFFALARQPAFPLLVGGMFLINFPQVIVSSQMKLVLYESGAASSFATWLLSVFAVSVIVGRFICGYALDRVQPHLVAVAALGMPAIGLFALASPYDAAWLLIGAIALTGLAQGAEGDVGAMLTSRKFELRHYSFIYSFVVAAMGAATAVGSLVLSFMLHRTDSYAGFLVLAGLVTLLGVFCFHLIGRFGGRTASEPGIPAPQSA